MNFRDKDIWERFILKYPGIFTSVQYDLHVGDTAPFNTLMDDDEDRNQDMLYRKRIDVVGHTADSCAIIEVKPNAGAGAIGQVKAYKTLYMRDEETNIKTEAIIVTDVARPDMAYLCKQEGVFLIVV